MRKILNDEMILKTLLNEATGSEFFREVCCERVFGVGRSHRFESENAHNRWNNLIKLTTGVDSFIQKSDLSNSQKVTTIWLFSQLID